MDSSTKEGGEAGDLSPGRDADGSGEVVRVATGMLSSETSNSDPDSSSNSSSNTPSHSEVKVSTSNQAKGSSDVKAKRTTTLSTIGKESKVYTLNSNIVKMIVGQLKLFDKLDFENTDETYVARNLEIIQAKNVEIDAMYGELVTLSENKVSEQTQTAYLGYTEEVRTTKERLEANQRSLEDEIREAEAALTEAKREMEEQERELAELLAHRRSRDNSRAHTPQAPTPAGSLQQPMQPVQLQHQPQIMDEPLQHNYRPAEAPKPSGFPQLHQSVINNIRHLNVSPTPSENKQQNIIIMKTAKSVEPDKFDGDPIHFLDWEVDFDTYIRTEGIEGADRLRHLKKYVTGEARKAIEGFFLLSTDVSYRQARKMLKDRYGNKQEVARSFRAKLEHWPRVSNKDGKELRDFGDFLSHIHGAMVTIPSLRILDDCNENAKLTRKLPEWLQNRWARQIDKTCQSEDRYPTFKEFTDFITAEARVMMLSVTQQASTKEQKPKLHVYQETSQQNHFKRRSFHSNARPPPQAYSHPQSYAPKYPTCSICQAPHRVLYCPKFKSFSLEVKMKSIKDHNLCYGCLRPGHRSSKCRSRETCDICKRGHPTVIHTDSPMKPTDPPQRTEEKPREETLTSLTTKATNILRETFSMVSPVYVKFGGRKMLVNLLYDTGADSTFMCNKVGDVVKPPYTLEKVTVHTLNGAITKEVKRYHDIIITGMLTGEEIKIKAYGQDEIYLRKEQIPTEKIAKEMDHLSKIGHLLPPASIRDLPVGLVIGSDYPEILFQRQAIEAGPGLPFATETMFGWTLCGGRKDGSTSAQRSYRTDIIKDQQIINILAQDFNDCDNYKMSQNDMKFMDILEKGTTQNAEGKYVLPLPFKENITQLENNKTHAERRYNQLIKKLKTDKEYNTEYTQFMDALINNGHAEEVKPLPNEKENQAWYLPHFGVRHPKKRKLRVVFDASAKHQGSSLNFMLVQGPDMVNSLMGILMRFRREEVAVCCDIEKMFYNFHVPEHQRDYLRFIWNGKEYRMTVHLFGATSSPAVATFGLRKLAMENKHNYPQAADFLQRDFYVDDGITSVSTVQEAQMLIQDATAICRQGGIRLHKFISNNRSVIDSIPISERSDSTQNIDIRHDQLPSERTLGLEWNIETDSFHFKVNSEAGTSTKRSILSMVARIYDPLGFLAPYILKGKQILQRVTRSQKSWDEQLDSKDEHDWREWVEQLPELNQFSIPRKIKKDVGRNCAFEIHHFSDASLTGYGACSYLRQITKSGEVHCSLLLAKSRVAPLNKTISIPRLELQAAVTAIRMRNTVMKELQMPVDREYFWSDSNIVLGYIANESKRFHMFVANRVFEIHQSSSSSQWNHVRSEDNPADCLSRGMTMKELKDSKWFTGPDFLRNPKLTEYITKNDIPRSIDETDTENVRNLKSYRAGTTPRPSVPDRYSRYSSWESLIRAMSTLNSVAKNRKWKYNPPTTEDLWKAELYIIQSVQMEQFSAELQSLQKNGTVQRGSSLTNLKPYTDSHGLLRVGGRLSKASIPERERNPLIIPKHSHLARLLVRHHHQKIQHLGRRSTLAAVRQAGFWIINGMFMVRAETTKCASCAKIRRPTETQLMGELPEERLHCTAPFVHTGMDVFGPFVVKDRRTILKRYGLLFTCLYSRACHIEMLSNLTTGSFINALRRFMAVRGQISTLLSDNGTNFVGARNLFEKEITSTGDQELKAYLLNNRITFKTNAPYASHKGGCWERIIRSVRAVLNGMALKYREMLDSETLQTAFMEVAAILNSMPLTATDIGSPDEEVISPNQLLTMKRDTTPAPPPGKYPNAIYGKDQWRKAQQLAEEFHQAWRTEYLTEVTKRQKWQRDMKNIKVGDIVLVTDQNNHRSEWSTAVVVEVHTSDDGKVREATLKLANNWLDKKGKPMAPATTLRRPVTKLVLLLEV